MNRRPRIAVTTSLGRGRYMWWFYWLAMNLLDVDPVRLLAPFDPSGFEKFDGFIIGGGDDISAELYQGVPAIDVRSDPARDKMEMDVLAYAVPRDIPVLGVCRGSQMMNVFLGGSLHQDIRVAYQSLPAMWSPLPRKSVTILPNTRLRNIFECEEMRVNSLHKQSVDKLGSGLIVAARDSHGVVQAIEDSTAYFCLGIQWHPEFLIYQSAQRRLFRAFVVAVEEQVAERDTK